MIPVTMPLKNEALHVCICAYVYFSDCKYSGRVSGTALKSNCTAHGTI